MSASAALPERPRAWVEVKAARVRRVAACWARAAARRVAHGWLIWEAISAALSRRNGVVAAARRRLWDELRANPAVRPHLNAPWAPGWFGLARRFPLHTGLFAMLLALAVTTFLAAPDEAVRLVCGQTDLAPCHAGLRGLAWVILAAQVTLLALLFPLVATLVPPLLGSRVSTSARVQLLLAHTEIEAAGASAIALGIVGAIGLAFSEGWPADRAVGFATFLAAWFALNLGGTAWFATRSLALLTPSGRIAATLSYAATRAWPAEAAPKSADTTLLHAFFRDAASIRECLEFCLRSDTVPGATVTVDLAAPARLVEVRLATLQAVACAVAHRAQGTPHEPIAFVAPFPSASGARREGRVMLAKARVPLTGIERWLIRRAHVFSSRDTASGPLTGQRLLKELVTDALDDLRSGNWPVLEERIDTLAALHGLLLRLASRRQADARRGSHVAQPMGSSDLSIGRSWSWALAYLPLVDTAAIRLPESRPAFRSLARLADKIGHEAGPSVPPAALTATDSLLASLAHRLYDRGAEAAGQAVDFGGVARKPMALPEAARDWYDETWREISGAWERALGNRAPRPPANVPPEERWALSPEHVSALMENLYATTDLVARAAVLGDPVGGGRALDLLLRWPGTLRNTHASGTVLAINLGALWPELLDISDCTPIEARLRQSKGGGGVYSDSLASDPLAVFLAAVEGAWADHCLALAMTLSRWSMEIDAPSPAADLLASLIHQRQHDPALKSTGMVPVRDPFAPGPLLRTVAAIVAAPQGSADSRTQTLENRLRRLGELAHARFVPGRWHGVTRPAFSFHDGGAQLAVCLLAVALKPGHGEPWPRTPDALGLASPSPAGDRVAEFFECVANATQNVPDDLLRRLAPSGAATDQEIASARKRVIDTCNVMRASAPLTPTSTS